MNKLIPIGIYLFLAGLIIAGANTFIYNDEIDMEFGNITNVTNISSNMYCLYSDSCILSWDSLNFTVDVAELQNNISAINSSLTTLNTSFSTLGDDVEANNATLTTLNASFTARGPDTTIGNCSSLGSCSDVAYVNYENAGNFNITGNISFNNIDTGALMVTITESGSNQQITSNVEGTNYLEVSTTGTFINIYANPGPSNSYEMIGFSETQGADTDLKMYEGGTGHNRFWNSGSMRIGGGAGYLCSNLTTVVDCDTPATGADLVVEDDVWLNGTIYARDWTNVSITTGQITNMTDQFAGNCSGLGSCNTIVYNGTGQTATLSNLTIDNHKIFSNGTYLCFGVC